MRFLLVTAWAGAALVGSAGPAARAQDPRYAVKPSALAPAGAPGEMRRVVQSFGTWTLVCDENLRARQRVCNISQEIVDAAGATAFSWSLAGTREGAPVMILRAPSAGVASRDATLAFAGGRTATVTLGTCGGPLCLGFLPVTREIGRALREDASATVTLPAGDRTVTLGLPLRDLKAALAALDGPGAAPARPKPRRPAATGPVARP